jgi:hypothetical protein
MVMTTAIVVTAANDDDSDNNDDIIIGQACRSRHSHQSKARVTGL